MRPPSRAVRPRRNSGADPFGGKDQRSIQPNRAFPEATGRCYRRPPKRAQASGITLAASSKENGSDVRTVMADGGCDAAGNALANRATILEHKMQSLEGLPDRVASLEVHIVQFRAEVGKEFSAVHQGMRVLGKTLRAEMRAGDEETRRQMRVLHGEVIARFALLDEHLNGRTGFPESRRRTGNSRRPRNADGKKAINRAFQAFSAPPLFRRGAYSGRDRTHQRDGSRTPRRGDAANRAPASRRRTRRR